jgi:hypothetical protein
MSDYSRNVENILEQLPSATKVWVESLPWQHRRYVLSLCHMVCAADPEQQAEFLDDYTADGLVVKKLADQEIWQRVCHHLSAFHLKTDLSEAVLRGYIRQFYIHSAQDLRCQPDLYLQSALKLAFNPEDRNSIFSYILGFELLKMMFGMSWLQHEKLYRLQRNQEEFFNCYVKPIQAAHRLLCATARHFAEQADNLDHGDIHRRNRCSLWLHDHSSSQFALL